MKIESFPINNNHVVPIESIAKIKDKKQKNKSFQKKPRKPNDYSKLTSTKKGNNIDIKI